MPVTEDIFQTSLSCPASLFLILLKCPHEWRLVGQFELVLLVLSALLFILHQHLELEQLILLFFRIYK